MAFRPNIPAYSTQGKSFSRTAAFPLEGYEIWTDLEALRAYAANTDASKDPSYIGQKVAYVDYEGNRVVHYGIEIDGTLKELGADKMGIEALTAADHGKIPKAFYVVDEEAEGEEGSEDYKPEVGHVEVRWVTPEAFEDTNTVTTVGSSDKSISVTEMVDENGNKAYDVKYDLEDKLRSEMGITKTAYPTGGDVLHLGDLISIEYTSSNGDLAKVVATTDDLVDYTVSVSTENPEDTSFKHYVFSQLGKEIAHIDIPKDLVVSSGTVVVATEEDKTLDETVVVGDTYIKLTIANQEKPLYINVKALVDIYSVADTSTIDMTLTGTEIKADVKISAADGNSLVANEDGLYVNAPTLPSVESERVEGDHKVVVDVYQEDGEVKVTREQLSFLDLANLPHGEGGILVSTINNDPYITLVPDNSGNVQFTSGDDGLQANIELKIGDANQAEASGDTAEVISALTASGDTISPLLVEVVTKKAWNELKETGERLINKDEMDKLAALVLGESGSVEISGTINAANVHGLGQEVIDIVTGSGDYVSTPAIGEEGDENYVPATIVKKLGIEKNAQVNKIEGIALPDAVLAINEKQVNIPAAIAGKYGVIKGGDETIANEVSIVDGIGKVAKISTDSFVQGENELVLNGGKAR